MIGTPKDPSPSVGKGPNPDEGETSTGQFAGLGLQMAVCMVGGLYLGEWVDRKLGSDPWFLIIGVFLGAGLSFYSMYKKLMAGQAREDAARKARREGKP